MKTATMLGLVFFVLCSLLVAQSFAGHWQGWRGSDGWGMNSPYQRMYNPAAVETLTGEIVAIETTTPMSGMGNGIHLSVKTAQETIAAHLGRNGLSNGLIPSSQRVTPSKRKAPG